MPQTLLQALQTLASFYGIQTAYTDTKGQRQQAAPDVLLTTLRLLGAPVETLAEVPEALRTRRLSMWQRGVEPVVVIWAGQPARVKIRLPTARATGPVACEVVLETGEGQCWEQEMAALPTLRTVTVEGMTLQVKELTVPVPLPWGYHRLHLAMAGQSFETLLLVAPSCAYALPEHTRAWGGFLPAYALHTAQTWGGGDFSALETLTSWLAELGGRVFGTLPLFSSFLEEPFDPSPYAPVSRLFWNPVYIDVTRAPGLDACPEARAVLQSGELQTALTALRMARLVDYRHLMAVKRRVLAPLAAWFFREAAEQHAGFQQFLAANPAVDEYARFCAVMERQRTPWPLWPAPLRDGVLAAGDYDVAAWHYHLYVQWVTQTQLAAFAARSQAAGVQLYLDLPLGAHPNGYDVWRERHLFVHDAATGAPPDSLFTGGQNWGLPPLHPEAIRTQGYLYCLRYLRQLFQVTRLLRIDHVMGLHRLFWIPRGLRAADGLYVRYAAREWYAILNLESHRHQVGVIGENLGTVPRYINAALARHRVHQMYVLQYQLSPAPEHSLVPVPQHAAASLNTHDMPSFAAFCQGHDITDRVTRGLLSEAESRQEYRTRQDMLVALCRFLHERGLLPDAEADFEAVLRASLTFLGASPAEVVLINLEDLWLDTQQQNYPGTYDERPNWRQKARYALETFRQMPQVVTMLQTINQHRQRHPQGDGSARSAARLQAGSWSPAGPRAFSPVTEGVLLSDHDLYLFNEGSHFGLYEKLGAHPHTVHGTPGTSFAVWAPNAREVAVIGDFNGWNPQHHWLHPKAQSGVWEGFIPGVGPGTLYKYHIVSHNQSYVVEKADPFGFCHEEPPRTASRVWSLDYVWGDQHWMAERARRNALDAPMAIYEMHLGSWRRVPEEHDRPLTYREMAPQLTAYVQQMGFTHVEFLPVMEHPFYGSWGYQSTGYFAPTSRYGTPQDFMYLVDYLHQHGIGVILDWVPSHFPDDQHGLAYFDGTHLYEHADPRQGFHPDWHSCIFNYGRHEVRSFLISSALFWLDRYHIDGLRVDAVASMLYLDYARQSGEWVPNAYGGRENLDAVGFLRRLNEAVYQRFPDVQTIAEESTSWPMVSRPVYVGGLGFGLKWDMGWMHDTLQYFQRNPIYRKFHHNNVTFRMMYAFSENFVLPLSHDEIVYGKGSLLGKMPGDDWQKFANVRALLGYMYAQPGKKLLFMGDEFGQWREWNHDASLDWDLLAYAPHLGLQRWVSDLNRLYCSEPAMYDGDCDHAGFTWVDCNDAEASVLCFLRRPKAGGAPVLVVCNFTPVVRQHYRVGVPSSGFWQELLNSDASSYGGSNQGNQGGFHAEPRAHHGQPYSFALTLPPLAMAFFKPGSGFPTQG